MKRIGDILTRHKTPVSVEDDVSYKQVTIRTNYKGVVLRGIQTGATIGTKRQWRVSANQFILSRIDARNGAFGIIPDELEGAIVTNDFLAFDINEYEVEREFFNVFLQSPVFLNACIKASRGNTNRKRVDEEFLLNFEIKLPPLPEQHDLIKKINKARTSVSIAQVEITHQRTLLEKLKQAILQEAIQGKLTEGWRKANPNVESARELLQRIQNEKASLIAEKIIRKGKRQEAREEVRTTLSLPSAWEFPDLDDITVLTTDGTHQTPTYVDKGRIFLSAQNVKPFKFMPETHKYVSEQAYLKYTKARRAEKGDLLLGRVGAGIGETAVIDQDLEFAIYVSLGLVKTFPKMNNPDYLAIVFNAPFGVRYAKSNVSSKGSAGNFNLGRIRSFPIPLPPLVEQAVIVEQVERLMVTCRELETEINRSHAHAADLLQTVLNEALGPGSITPPMLSKRSKNDFKKLTETEIPAMNPKTCSLKSFILHSFKMSSGYRSLSNPDCEFHEDIEIPREAAPICLVGLNGSGKSNLIEAIADVFCFLELINLPWASLSSTSSKYRKNNHEFEISYTIKDENGTRLILIRKTKKSGADFFKIDEDGKETPITVPRERLMVLPRRIIGYSSGLNETVSHTFLRTRTLYSQEVRDAAPTDNTKKSRDVFDTRTLYMDYENNSEILLCNYIFRKPKELEFIKRFTRVAGVSSFELRFNRKITGKQGKSSIARITDELASYLEKFARCAGQEYDKKQLKHQFSYKLNAKTKKLFIKEFETAENLFLAMYKWSLLNALVLSDDQRKVFLKDDITKGTLERPPVVPPKSRLFDVADMKVTLSEPNIIIDYSGLSDGEHQFVQVFGTVLLFNEPGTLFLFDEPESHFNPEWRTQFNSILNCTPNAATHEYIISTHSPYIISGSRGKNVYKFERNGPSVTCDPVDFETYGASFDDLLKKLFSIKSLIDTGAKDELGKILKKNNLEEMESAVGEFAESREKRRLYEAILKKQEQKG